MPLAVGKQGVTSAIDRGIEAQRGQYVLQSPTPAHVHVHVARSHQRQATGHRQSAQMFQPLAVVGLQMAFKGDPAAIGKGSSQPLRILNRRPGRSHPERQTIGYAAHQIIAGQLIVPLLGAPPAERDDGAEIAVTGAVLRQQNQLHTTSQKQFATNDQLEPERFGRHMRPHSAGHRTLVGNGQRGITQGLGLPDQFLRMRCAAQEAEVGDAVQLGVIGERICHTKSHFLTTTNATGTT